MIKLQTLLLALFIVTFSVHAQTSLMESEDQKNKETALSSPQLKDRYYLAVAMGYDSYKMNEKIQLTHIKNDQTLLADPILNLTGLAGELIVGYGKYFKALYHSYLGVEFFMSGTAADTDYELTLADASIFVDTDIIVNGTYGINLLPGFKINQATLVYAKLGVVWSLISIEETFRENTWTSVEINESHTSHGLTYGVGLESAVDHFFSVRAELAHAGFSSFTSQSGTKISPSNNQVLVSLAYHFA